MKGGGGIGMHPQGKASLTDAELDHSWSSYIHI